MKLFKLYVKDDSDTSISILKYINRNINVINEMGVLFKIIKISSKQLTKPVVERLRDKGLNKFPALLLENGRVISGVEAIKKLCDNNKKSYIAFKSGNDTSARNAYEKEPMDTSRITDDAIEEYYKSQMSFEAMANDNKGSDDMTEGSSADYNRRVSQRMSKRRSNNKTAAPPMNNQPADNIGGGGGDDTTDYNNNTTQDNDATGDDIFDQRFTEGLDEY